MDAKALPTHGGVYLIADEADRPILLASGQNLRRVVIHRLAAPPPDQKSRRTNLAEIARRVHWTDTFGRFEAALTHWRIARQLYPRNYRDLIGFGPAEFVRVDLAERLPRLAATRDLRDDGAMRLGPFATRKAADAWIDALTDGFDLCRYYNILEQAPNGQACAYFDMGRCPAPCDGRATLESYRATMAEAWAFSTGRTDGRMEGLRTAMRDAAAKLAFEQAATARGMLERLEALRRRPENRHAADLAATAWLTVQRAGPARRKAGATLVRPYVVSTAGLWMGAAVALAEAATAAEGWLAAARSRAGSTDCAMDWTQRGELIWLLAKFLFQEERAPGVFLRSDALPGVAALVGRIEERFAQADDDAEENSGVPPSAAGDSAAPAGETTSP